MGLGILGISSSVHIIGYLSTVYLKYEILLSFLYNTVILKHGNLGNASKKSLIVADMSIKGGGSTSSVSNQLVYF